MQTCRSLALQQDRCFRQTGQLGATREICSSRARVSVPATDRNSKASRPQQLVGLARPSQPVQLLRASCHQFCSFHLRGKRIPYRHAGQNGAGHNCPFAPCRKAVLATTHALFRIAAWVKASTRDTCGRGEQPDSEARKCRGLAATGR